MTHPEDVAAVNPLAAGGRGGAWPATPLPEPGGAPRGSKPRPLPPVRHPHLQDPSPLGFGGHLALHSEALPRFEIQVAGDQTLQRRDPSPRSYRTQCPGGGGGVVPPGSSDPARRTPGESGAKVYTLFLRVVPGQVPSPNRIRFLSVITAEVAHGKI